MLKRITISFLTLFLYGENIAQKKDCPYSLRIQLIYTSENLEKSPAVGAEIFAEQSHSLTQTDESGKAYLTGLCAPTSDIEINHLGNHYHLILESQAADANATAYYKVYLKFQSNSESGDSNSSEKYYPEVELIRDTLPIEQLPYAQIHAKAQTQGDALRNGQLLAMPLQNLARSLEPLPMTQTLSTGMGIGKPVVQGMFGQRLPLLNNGFRQEGQTWGLDHAPEMDLWGTQTVQLLRGSDALAIAADAWGNAINFINQYDFHQFNRDYTQLASAQLNGRGLQLAGRYIQGRENQSPKPKHHPYGKGHYWLYSLKATGNYSTPTHTLSNTAAQEASVSYGNLWNSQRGYWGIKAVSNREFHAKAYFFRSGIFSESHIGNVNDLLLAMQRTEPLNDADFSYCINRPMQQAMHIHAGYNNLNTVLNKYIVHHKFALQMNQRWEYDPHRSSTVSFAQLNLWQGTINQYTGFSKIKPNALWQTKWVFQNTSQWQRYAGYYFLPDYQQWQPNLHVQLSNKRNVRAQHSLVLRSDLLIRHAFPKNQGVTANVWSRAFGPSAAYSLIKQLHNQQWQLHISQLWRAPSINELYTRGVHHGAASYEEGNDQLKPETGQKIEILWLINGKSREFRATAFYQQSQNFIALFPMSTPVLTVRGAFPGYEYKQLPTQYTGAEIQYTQRWDKLGLQVLLRAAGIYATLQQGADTRYPNFLPCPKGSLQINKKWKHSNLMIETVGVGKQPFYTPGSDFLPPPEGYVLVNFQWQFSTKGHEQHAHWVVYGENMGNKSYRDYMDRFRYFTNQAGMNVGIKWLYDIHHHHQHQHELIKTNHSNN